MHKSKNNLYFETSGRGNKFRVPPIKSDIILCLNWILKWHSQPLCIKDFGRWF